MGFAEYLQYEIKSSQSLYLFFVASWINALSISREKTLSEGSISISSIMSLTTVISLV